MGKLNRMRREGGTERVELSEKNIPFRLIAVLLLIVVAAAAFTFGISSLISRRKGWTVVEVNASDGSNCAQEFVFQYDLGAGSMSGSAEYRLLTRCYTDAATTAYKCFNSNEAFEGCNNVYTINAGVDQVITIDDVLYEAFELMQQRGSRALYLAPIYYQYNNLFGCNFDYEADNFDPTVNPDMAAFFGEVCRFANDPDAVRLELLGENKVCLRVSQEYREFAKEYGITKFIDFFWMKNAFIADYLADQLAQNGFKNGALSSFDGFSRNLDERGTSYSFNIFSKQGKDILRSAVMEYAGPLSIVSLKNFPLSQMDSLYCYEREDGRTICAYADMADGLCRCSADMLTAYSAQKSCAEILLEMMDVFIADELDEAKLTTLAQSGTDLIFCSGGVIKHTDPQIRLNDKSYSAIPIE